MRSNGSMESMLRKLRYPTTAERRERTLQNIFRAMDEVQEQVPAVRRVRIALGAARRLRAPWDTARFS